MKGLWVAPSPTDKPEQVFFPVATTVRNCTTLKPLPFFNSSYDNEEEKGERQGKEWEKIQFEWKIPMSRNRWYPQNLIVDLIVDKLFFSPCN